MQGLGIIPDGQTIQDFIVEKAKSVVNLGSVGTMVGGFFSAAGSIFVGLFSILFIAFFFLKDEGLFESSLLLLLPEKHHDATRKVIAESKNLLMFILRRSARVLGVMSIGTIFLWIFGVKMPC
jgi:predicted PurR-regulated permease PerM